MTALDIDADAYLAGLEAQLKRWDAGARLAVQATGYDVMHHAQRHVQVDTGRTRDSGRVKVRNSANIVTAQISFSGAAVWVEFGTQPHRIYPRTADALAFFWTRVGRYTIVPKVPVTLPGGRRGGTHVDDQGRLIVRKGYVDHPGTRPYPFMRPAMLRAPGYFRAQVRARMGAG